MEKRKRRSFSAAYKTEVVDPMKKSAKMLRAHRPLILNYFKAKKVISSGVVEVNTRGGTDDWKWLFEDPIPRLRWIDYRPHGVESFGGPNIFNGRHTFRHRI